MTGLLAAIPAELMGDATAVLLINSLAEGFGNATSDIDLMLVSRKNANVVDEENWIPVFRGGQRFDLYVVTEEALTRKVQAATAAPSIRPHIDFMHKLRRARPILGVESWNALVGPIDWSAFDRQLVDYYFNELPPMADDVVGSLGEGDIASAALSARALAALGMDGYLASLGESQPRPKWRMKKARRALGENSPVLHEYLQLEFGATPPEQLEEHWLRRCMDFCRALMMQTHFPRTRPAISDGSLKQRGTYQSAPYAVSSALEQDFILHNPKPLFKVKRPAILLWYLAPYASSASHLAELHDTFFDGAAPVDSDSHVAWVTKTLDMFVGKGLMHGPAN